jgi:hypothetical protein
MFERHGIDISRKTMGGWMAQCAELLDPLYQLMKKDLLNSKVIGTDDTTVKGWTGNFRLPGSGGSGRMSEMLAIRWSCATTRPPQRAPVRRNFWKATKGICRRTPTPSMTHFSSPNAA